MIIDSFTEKLVDSDHAKQNFLFVSHIFWFLYLSGYVDKRFYMLGDQTWLFPVLGENIWTERNWVLMTLYFAKLWKDARHLNT